MARPLVDLGYGAVPPLPIPARERPVVPDPELVIIGPDGTRTIGKSIEAVKAEAGRNLDRENEIRGLAKTLTDNGAHPVKVQMPSGDVITVGGETLVHALARGAQPIED